MALTEPAEALSFRVKSLRDRFAPRPPPGAAGSELDGFGLSSRGTRDPEPLLLRDLRVL